MELRLLNRKCGLIWALRAFELGLARQHLRFLGLHLRVTGRLHGEIDVMQRDGQHVEQEAEREQRAKEAAEASIEIGLPLRTDQADALGEDDPEQGGDRARRDLAPQDPSDLAGADRQHAAQVPGREAHEGIDQAQRQANGGGLGQAESRCGLQQEPQQKRHRQPKQQVDRDARRLSQNWVHAGL